MAILRHVANDGGMFRNCQLGDVMASMETIPATITDNAVTITGAMLASSFIQRTETGTATDTLDTAANIISALSAGLGTVGLARGTTWRIRWINNPAYVITVAATSNTGVTIVNPTVNASSVKEFLMTVGNGTPASSVQATTVSGSAVISGLTTAQVAALSIGMIVTNSVVNVQGQTIIGKDSSAGTVTLSGNANATNTTPVTVSFSPVITLTGIGQYLL